MNFYDMTWLERLLFLKRIKGGSSGHEETTTSNTFVTDMVAPLRKLLLSFAPKQSGSGDPSPDNVRPISGWGGVSVTRCGSNLRGGIDFANDLKIRIPSIAIDTAEKTASFAYNASTTGGVYVPNVDFKENTRYTFILTLKNTTAARTNLRIYYTDNSYTDLPDLSGVNIKQTIAVPTSANKTVLTITRREQGGTTVLYYDECGVFEGVLTADDFEPYAGQTYSVSWQTEAGTVYGGTLDMVSGVLTVDRAIADMGALDWTYNSAYTRFSATVPLLKRSSPARSIEFVCTSYKSQIGGSITPSVTNGVVYNGSGEIAIYVHDLAYTDASTFKTALATSDAKIVYPLQEPQTYQLTPQQINTLIGTNVITTDANVEEIIYLKKAE